MLGLGWSEMLVISVVVLIVVGPKDLPMMLRNLGRVMGSVRKMSNEFRREIDKAIALDEVKEAKKAITDPLRQTSDEIAREFNTLKDGKYEPSGKLKPSEPGKESVADEIRRQAGLPEKKGDITQSKAAESMKAKVRAQQARLEAKKQAAAEVAETADAAPAKKVTAAKRNPVAKAADSTAAKAPRKRAPAKKKAPAKASAEAGSGDQ